MSGYPQSPQQPFPQQPVPQQPFPQQQFPQQGYPQQGYPQQGYPQSYPPPTGNPFSDQAPNPYAAPQQAGYYQQPQKMSPFAGLWRQGSVLVMHKLAPLPEICLKSNEPAARRLKRTMYWHHPALYMLLISWPIYLIVALILQKNATLQVPLTDAWFARRRTRMLIAWGIGLLGLAVFVGGIALADTLGDATALAIVGALVLFFGGIIYGLLACRLVTSSRISDEYVWLKGVHPDYLNRLEIWPYNI